MVLPPPSPHCTAHLNGGNYVCTRPVAHDFGHVYAAADAPDRHTTTEANQT